MSTADRPVVHSDPDIMSGTTVFVGTRVPFETPDKLIADFQRDIARWNRENRHS